MRYLFLALVIGATVVGAGWVVLDTPVSSEWRQDLLDLAPFTAIERNGDVAEPDKPGAKKKRRKRRGKAKTGSAPRPASDAPPTAMTATPDEVPAPPPPPGGGPSQADVHYQMGLAYIQQKRIPGAISELKKCIALNPRHALAYRALGMAHSVMGKQSAAVEAFRKFVKLAPGHKDATKVRAIIEAHEAGR